MRKNIIELIFNIAKESDAFDRLENHLLELSHENLRTNLIACGYLPEVFGENSSEEKLWGKFSDILLAKSLNFLRIEAEVLVERGNSADVRGNTNDYTIVGDAKTFRVSRTAVNPKDLKIPALNEWRRNDTFSLLVAPLTKFPTQRSQIYEQAIQHNVTLLSYPHLAFMLNFYNQNNLQTLWSIGNTISQNNERDTWEQARIYWSRVDNIICEIFGQPLETLNGFKQDEINKINEISNEALVFYQNKKEEIAKLSKKELIERLIKSEKIGSKITRFTKR